MGFFGNLLGQGLGHLAGGVMGDSGTGANIGGQLGGLLPFSHGGRVRTPGMRMPRPVVGLLRYAMGGVAQAPPVIGYSNGGAVQKKKRGRKSRK